MSLTPLQQSVLSALTAEWQTPVQIAERLPDASVNPTDVNQALKDLLREGLAQANPVVLGLYRLAIRGTDKGTEE
ncbi:hypothetical protein GXP70_01425 [Paenibacillus lycopersici]|uniref:MarR family transcriptional regulator n=1 Tax=Paenibacillus lycopersici TaxID=2704462 RepID=A0A6C0FNQ0_9BACL|nr:hypothetical protein [Paenibacillus lycopersici]QHT58766.1 hypothetical protein GXP70_01425 [Paenibacillus lycopersici]